MSDLAYDATVYPDKATWLQNRDRLGASETAAAMGLSPYLSSYALWSQKCGLSVPGPETRAMRRGSLMEDFIADEYAMEHKRELRNLGKWTICRSRKYPHKSCTPDRLLEPIDDRGVGVLEIKSVTNRRAWAEGFIPEHYRIQVVDSMITLGLTWGVLAGYVAGTDEIIPVEIELQRHHEALVVDETAAFWRMVLDGREALANGKQPTRFPDPDASEATMEALRQRYAEENARVVAEELAGPEASALESEWSAAADDMSKVSRRLDAVKVRAMTMIKDRPEVRLPGGTLVSWRTDKRGTRVLRRYAAK